ncbi:MAG: hypothetical protein AB7D50_00050 [Bacilli bacterium]
MIENRAIQFAIDYSIYHLLILENEKYKTSIPARGLSGQVYKGAIFWDTEIFMLPFYAVFREWSRWILSLKRRVKFIQNMKSWF